MSNPVVHFEIGSQHKEQTADYFSQLFGWKMQAMGPATMIDTGSGSGIQGHITALGHEPQRYTIFYVQVDDVQAYLDKAGTLGGKTLVPPSRFRPVLSPGLLIRKVTRSGCGSRNETAFRLARCLARSGSGSGPEFPG